MITPTHERVLADDFWAVLLFPLQLVWMCFPTTIRNRITRVPWEVVVFCLKLVWALMAYYWLYSIVAPYFHIPPLLAQSWEFISQSLADRYESVRVWYNSVTLSPFSVAFPSFSIMTWLFSKIKTRKETAAQRCYSKLSTLFYVPERAIQGSELIPAKELPSFVCYIFGISDDDSETLVGCGFRTENVIMTAAHNLTGYERVKIMSNTAVCIVDVSIATVHPYDDLAYFKLSDRDFSMLGMSKGRLLDHAAPKGYPMICQVFGPGTPVSFTMGAVTPVEHFGKVTYNGSTTHGFSGSPYIQNKTIVGMHLGAGMVNLGLDAAYMRMLVSIRQESTEDWLMDMIEEDQLNKREVKWERSPVDPDEVYIKRQGKYFTLDADTFFKVYSPQSIVRESKNVTEKLPTFVYSDSKNGAMASARENANAGANGQTSVIRNCVQTPLTAESYKTPMSIKTLEETLATESHEPTLVPQSSHLNCTSSGSTYQPERTRRQQQRKNKKLAKSSQKFTDHGTPGLELIR